MNDDTKGELVESVASVLGTLGKELFVRRSERQMMERRAELDKEVAEVRARASGDLPAGGASAEVRGEGAVGNLDAASRMAEEYDSLLARAQNEEQCGLCKQLIAAARDKPLREQRTLLPSLRDFIAGVEDDASQQELVARIKQSDELVQLLRENVVGEGGFEGRQRRPRQPSPGNTPSGTQETL